jgi:very-short-patch-repair endonuclease
LGRKHLTPIARKLRANQTDAEDRLWSCLRSRRLEGEKFVRQLQIHAFVADFACRTARLAVELDGG